MSYLDSLSSIPSDKRDFVYKIYDETHNNSISIASDIYDNDSSNTSFREIQKATFLSLVTENNKLLENEKEYCKERFIYDFELDNAVYKVGEPKGCNKCKFTRY